MKVFLSLAMLVATMLLVTNKAFAPPCDENVCYTVTVTYDDTTSHGEFWNVCLNDDGTGNLAGIYPLYLFGGGPIGFSFDAHPRWTKWVINSSIIPVSGDIWTDVFGIFLNGEGYAGAPQNSRWIAKGTKVPCP